MERTNLFNPERKSDNSISNVFDKFIHWMNDGVGNFTKISETDISTYFAEDFEYDTNGVAGATNAKELHDRFEKAKEKFQTARIHFPLQKLEIAGSQVNATYKVTFIDKNGTQFDDTNTISVIFNNENKVSQFHQAYTMKPPMNDATARISLAMK